MRKSLPLVYACAGCSFAGRVSYELAQELSRGQVAEMSCLAGLAAMLLAFLRVLEGRETWVIDGWPLECAKGVFDNLERSISRHIRLREYGVAKNEPRQTNPDVADLAVRISRVLEGNGSGDIAKQPVGVRTE